MKLCKTYDESDEQTCGTYKDLMSTRKLLGNNIKSSHCDEYPHIKIPTKTRETVVTPENIDKYRSPIDVIVRETKFEFGNAVYKAVQDVGISVDKEELVKALKYDREQYYKGYADGYEAAVKKIQDALGGVK